MVYYEQDIMDALRQAQGTIYWHIQLAVNGAGGGSIPSRLLAYLPRRPANRAQDTRSLIARLSNRVGFDSMLKHHLLAHSVSGKWCGWRESNPRLSLGKAT
jgi:hypothetical protein